MGTNYYLRYNMCIGCHRYSEIHIGKSSYGWAFIFKAIDDYYDITSLDPKISLIGDDNIHIKISSYKEWKEFFQKYVIEFETAKIFDEYGTEISLEEFYKLIELKKDGKNHVTEMKSDPYYRPDMEFIDNEGNSFSKHEFS